MTAEALGSDPSGPNVTRINSAAFREGLPSTLPLRGIDASNFMIEMVHKYPGEVEIYTAGPLTNIAKAITLSSTFAQTTKSIVIQGGFAAPNMLQVTLCFETLTQDNERLGKVH